MLSNYMIRIADAMVKKEIIKEEDKAIVAHGLNAGSQLLVNILTTVMMGLAFDLVLESLIFLISFSFIRTYAGGYHCKKVMSCYFFSSGIVIAVLTTAKFTPTRFIPIITILMLLLSLSVILKFAPVETVTKPLDEVEKRVFRKRTRIHLMIECIIILTLFTFKQYIFYYVICFGVLVSGILVLLGCKQNN